MAGDWARALSICTPNGRERETVAIETICSGCGQKLSVADENAGKRARCPACGQIYTIPQPGGAGGTGHPDPRLGETAPHPSGGANTPQGHSGPTASGAHSPEQYWMRATDGAEYGPADRATLNRWFAEGRVGPGYMIRQHEPGNWQSAEAFRPQIDQPHTASSSNPYTDQNPYRPAPTTPSGNYNYPKGDQGGVILAMGILGFMCCPIFGVVAWIMGSSALNDIQAGRADPGSKGMVQVGYYLGIASVAIMVLQIVIGVGWFFIAAVANL